MRRNNTFIYLFFFLIIVAIGLHFFVDTRPIRVHQHQSAVMLSKEPCTDEFCTHLPIIIITGNVKNDRIKNIESTDKICQFQVVDNKNEWNKLSSQSVVTSKAHINIRGKSSYYFDKKSYSVHLVKDRNKNKDIPLLGMQSNDKWVLHGPFLDRTLIRNYLAMNLSGEVMNYAPDVVFCEVFLNDEYQGIYLLMESVSRGEGRINISKIAKNSIAVSYILRWDRESDAKHKLNNFIYYTMNNQVSAIDVYYPSGKSITEKRLSFITEDISDIERLLYSTKQKDIDNVVDLDEFSDYFIINEFFRNIDSGNYSTYFYKDLRGKLKPCVWDFNNSFDNYPDTTITPSGFSLIDTPFYSQLIKNKKFIDLVISKYRIMREGILSEEYLIKYIDDIDVYLGDAKVRNEERWGYVYDLENYSVEQYLVPVERNYASREEAMHQLKTYIIARGQWLDNHIDVLYQYCHEPS